MDACTHSKTVNRPWEAIPILQTIFQTCHWSNLENGLPHSLDVLQGPGQVSQGCMQRRLCMREQSGLCTVGGVGCTRCNHAAVERVGHAIAQASMQAMSATWPISILCCVVNGAGLHLGCAPAVAHRGGPRPRVSHAPFAHGVQYASSCVPQVPQVGRGRSVGGGCLQTQTLHPAPSKRQALPHQWH